MYLLLLFADTNIETPPSMHPSKRICDITGYEVIFSLHLYLLHINSSLSGICVKFRLVTLVVYVSNIYFIMRTTF